MTKTVPFFVFKFFFRYFSTIFIKFYYYASQLELYTHKKSRNGFGIDRNELGLVESRYNRGGTKFVTFKLTKHEQKPTTNYILSKTPRLS